MLLKKIRMVGFKSFADETVFEATEGITAIVGPNGCGKSNILDAVRWVLGEKSARGLRGRSMEDVIFLGSENRKPAGMAEVEMIFDNQDRSLSLDQNEVSVGRRIYLNSGSEYLLNGKKTTRREIEKIFMDTGIGKSAYSIMEQGRMSEILSASPEDRRTLFDEAAGVSRFKAEREETLARLSDTEQNLLRLNDILKSKKEEMDHLAAQARKTEQYLKLKEHLDRRRMNLIYLNMSDLRGKKEKIEQKIEAIVKKRNDLHEKIEEREQKVVERESVLQETVEEMHNLDRLFHQEQSRMEALQANLDRLVTETADRKGRLEGIEERRQVEQKLYKEIQGRIQASMQLELDLGSEIKVMEDSAARLFETIEKRNGEIKESIEIEDKNSEELRKNEGDQALLVDELKNVTRDLIVELETWKKDLEKKDEFRNRLKGSILSRLTESGKILSNLASLSGEPLLDAIRSIDLSGIQNEFLQYEAIEDEFRSAFFGKTGRLAKKEDLDSRMDALSKRKEQLLKENHLLSEKRKLALVSLEKEKNRRVEIELELRDSRVRRESSLEQREGIETQLKESQARIEYYNEEIRIVQEEKEKILKEHADFKKELEVLEKNKNRQSGAIESIRKKIEKIKQEIQETRDKSKKDRESVERLIPELSELERGGENLSVQENNLQEELYNDFQISPGELTAKCSKENIRKENEESEYRRIRAEISSLGQFNALAIEELKRSEETYSHLKDQEIDIQEAKKNILDLLKEIDDRSREMFLDTFGRIQNNFSEIFQTLFGGGNASLTMTDPDQPMKSGIDIMVQPPGKKNRSLSLLSGGEKNMTAIALMFATYLVRPSPFCFLDEIDAPLDETNVERFLRMLAGFAGRSQFLVITHNKQTMVKSQAIFGVTQEEPGISKIVSVSLSKEASNVSGF